MAKDVAAMANTRGGLLVYGVTDKTTVPVGIDPDEVNEQQYAQWIRNHVQPYLPDLTFTALTSPDGQLSFLAIDVPASPMAPHHVYGTAAKDKDQQAAVVPYRDRDHTAWMAEHQIERAYRERFTRTQHAQDETDRLLAHALGAISRFWDSGVRDSGVWVCCCWWVAVSGCGATVLGVREPWGIAVLGRYCMRGDAVSVS
ncbi:helix-turn-helix domain-containing protein [Streptomyces sp. NPDC057238]|uniref:AlbA family DNA-binding domain-containing protein n=1 Tax=Streptomyces sp. NPDC057238 TaxID=3346060 RepID=UPI003639465B